MYSVMKERLPALLRLRPHARGVQRKKKEGKEEEEIDVRKEEREWESLQSRWKVREEDLRKQTADPVASTKRRVAECSK